MPDRLILGAVTTPQRELESKQGGQVSPDEPWTIARLIKASFRIGRTWYAWSVAVSVVAAGLLAVLPVLAGRMVESYVSNGLGPETMSIGAGFVVCTALALIVSRAVSWLLRNGDERAKTWLTRLVMQKVLEKEIGYFDRHDTQRLGNRMLRQAAIVLKLPPKLGDGVRRVLAASVAMVQLAIYAWYLVPICLFGGAIVVWKAHRQVREIKAAAGEVREAEEDVYSRVGEVLAEVRMVRAYGAEEREMDGVLKVVADREAISLSRADVIFRAKMSTEMMGFGFWLLTAGAAVWMLQGDLASLTTALIFVKIFQDSVVPFADIFRQAAQTAGGAEQLVQMLNAPAHMVRGTVDPGVLGGQPLMFDGVTFAYPSAPDRTVLEDISFTAPAGSTIAIVGASGAGKTTLLRLIARFYDPTEGSIRIGSQDLRDFDDIAYRRRLGFVGQSPAMLDRTLRDNLAFANPGVSDTEIERICREVQAWEIIDRQKHGLDTHLGHRRVRMSKGQAQRLAIARALLAHPDIVLLDEPTAALDTKTEAQVQTGFDALLGTCMTFVAAHRLSTVRRADRILVLDEGRIVQQGTHDELLVQPGAYAELLAQTELWEPVPLKKVKSTARAF
jgi:ABC-type multidrug transport system fused ATPase/permease subunit